MWYASRVQHLIWNAPCNTGEVQHKSSFLHDGGESHAAGVNSEFDAETQIFDIVPMVESVTTLPFNLHVGIQRSMSGEGLLELPAGGQFLNHIGTVHAGAQLALAEACSGEFLLNSLANESGIVPVVRRVEAKFKKPANGKLTAKINTSLTAIDESIAELAMKGRCLLTIGVDVYDQHGQHSLSSSFEWFISKTTSK